MDSRFLPQVFFRFLILVQVLIKTDYFFLQNGGHAGPYAGLTQTFHFSSKALYSLNIQGRELLLALAFPVLILHSQNTGFNSGLCEGDVSCSPAPSWCIY